jgi:predicted AAA+ superfamily ATPase
MEVQRPRLKGELLESFRQYPVVALLGPRQSGKTTLAREFARSGQLPYPGDVNYFDLEDPDARLRLSQPKLALSPLKGLIVIDEVQRHPDLFPILRVLSDRPDSPAKFLILGSASRDLISQSSESLAGRIHYVEVGPFAASEVGTKALAQLWLRGGFPRSFLAVDDASSMRWRRDYIATYLERDIPALGLRVPPETLRRFWLMLANSHGQIWNASQIGASLGVSSHTASRYLDILVGTFMLRRLSPWYENIGKRQVKTPKVYFRDAGILHGLLGLGSMDALRVSPLLGHSWEGFALEQILLRLQVSSEEAFFWAVHSQAELDLLIMPGGRRYGFEVKYSDAPAVTKSMHMAVSALGLHKLFVVYPGDQRSLLDERIELLGISQLTEFTIE